MLLKMETLNHCHVEAERAWLFHSEDTQSTEEEYLHLLHSLVLCLKPERVLETGSFRGLGTCVIARALKSNELGHLTSLEVVPRVADWARELLRVNALNEWADVLVENSLEFLSTTDQKFDFALFDSMIPLRCQELTICLDRGLLKTGDMVALHDTSRVRTITPGVPDPQTPQLWKEIEAFSRIKFVEFPFSRGLVLAQIL